jgi:hypothetical protein
MDSMNSATEDKLVFPRVKGNAVVYLVVSVAIILIAIVVWCVAERMRGYDPSRVKTVAVVGGCLAVVFATYNVFELLDDTPELIIDREGIIHNIGAAPMGRIPWQDVTAVRCFDLGGLRCVVIDVVDHQKYIERCGRLMRVGSKMATELAGSPLAFSGESVGLTREELLRILNEAFQKYGRPAAIVTPVPLVSAPVPQEQAIDRISENEAGRIRRAMKLIDRITLAMGVFAIVVLVVGHGVVALRVPPQQLPRMQSRVEGAACALLALPLLTLIARFILESYYVHRTGARTLREGVHIAIGVAIPIAIFIGGAITFGVTAVELWSQP